MTQPPTATPRTPPRRPQQGMTLLELLVVIALMSVVGFMALSQVGDDLNQARYEDTRNRLEMIRKAIIGDTSRTLNGQPEIRGFVADMGRLPANLQELIEREFCSNPALDQAACTGAETWTSMPAYAHDATAGLWAGWNGPYLNASPESDYPRFRDGWGNDDGSNDFGWVFNDSGGAGPLLVQSTGMDGTAGGSDYEADYPPAGSEVLIAANTYRTLITDSGTNAQNDEQGGITVDFGSPAPCWTCSDNSYDNRTACEGASPPGVWSADTTITTQADCTATPPNGAWQPTEMLCLRIGYRQDGAIDTVETSGSDGTHSLTWDGSAKTARFSFEDPTGPDYDEDTYLPMGQMTYRVFLHDGTNCTNDEYPKDAEWRLFTLVPGSALPPLPWAVR